MMTCPTCGTNSDGKFCSACGTSLGGGHCRGCNAPLAPGARFCAECGTPVGVQLDPQTVAPAGPATWIPWTIAAACVVGVFSFMVAQRSVGPTAPADAGAAATAPFAGGGTGGPAPDISQMTPRERAGRLYDRIMRYVEQGKTDSIQFFAPMALGSFEALGAELDLDARYDYGRVAMEVGSPEIAAAQADTILKQAPTHLLGLALAARTATLRGDKSGGATFWTRFRDAKDAELAKKLPEYEAHATDIARATELADKR